MTDEIDRVSELTCQTRSPGLEKRDRGRWNGCWPERERRRKGSSVVGTQPGWGVVAAVGASGGGRPEVPHAAAAARFLLISVTPPGADAPASRAPATDRALVWGVGVGVRCGGFPSRACWSTGLQMGWQWGQADGGSPASRAALRHSRMSN